MLHLEGTFSSSPVFSNEKLIFKELIQLALWTIGLQKAYLLRADTDSSQGTRLGGQTSGYNFSPCSLPFN